MMVQQKLSGHRQNLIRKYFGLRIVSRLWGLFSKLLVLGACILCLATVGRYFDAGDHFLAHADDDANTSAAQANSQEQTISAEDSSNVSEDDYRIPKTVYIGVDSIAAPKVLPESVSAAQRPDEDQSTQSTATAQPVIQEDSETAAIQAPNDSQTVSPVENTDSSENSGDLAATTGAVSTDQPEAEDSQVNEPENADKEVVAAVADVTPKVATAPEKQQAQTNSINNVSKRITLFKSIDVDSELDVPAGLPEDLSDDQDHREGGTAVAAAQNTDTSATDSENTVDSSESQTASVDNEPETAEQTEAEQTETQQNAEDGKQPAIVVNLTRDLQIDSRNEWGWTKLMSAAIEGDLTKVSELLELGANPDIAGDDGRSPLMAASWNKHYEVVDSLITAGADVNLRNRDGWTALSFAAWNGDVVIVKSLLGVSANRNIKTADGYTPLQLAEQKGHQEIVELLQ